MISIPSLKILILITLLCVSFVIDITKGIIPNKITLTASFFGAIANTFHGGYSGFISSLEGWAVPIVMLMVLYKMNVMGGGDIKLFGAIGSIMGLPFAFYSFLFSLYFGGMISFFILIKRKVFFKQMGKVFSFFKLLFLSRQILEYTEKNDKSSKFAFSIAILPGTLIYLMITLR